MRIILLLTIASYTNLFSQSISYNVISEYEDTLSYLAHKIMHEENETLKLKANNGFISELKEVLKYKESYTYPFDSLNTISILSPKDKSFRIFTWILLQDNLEYQYFGIIIIPGKKEDNYNRLVILEDKSNEILDPENQILNENRWYGSLYYDIISIKKKEYYTLLAWDGNNSKSKKKIIEILQIKDNEVIFGKKIFKNKDEIKSRIILEYNINTSMSLRFDPQDNSIIFDNLTSLTEGNQNQFLIQDGSFNRYKNTKGKWIFEEDIDIRIKESLPQRTKKKGMGLFNK